MTSNGNTAQKHLIKIGREKREQGRHLAPAPALFVLFIGTRQTAKWGKNKPIQARSGTR